MLEALLDKLTKSPKIFISYRRRDAGGEARALAQRIETAYGEENVFFDVDQPAGRDFITAIERSVREADAFVLVIGPNWEGKGDSGVRLDDPTDHVRREVHTALAEQVPIYPVFVRGASMPAREALPEELVPLHRVQGLHLHDTNWRSDLGQLLDELPPPSSQRRRLYLRGLLSLLAVGVAVAVGWLVQRGGEGDGGAGEGAPVTLVECVESWNETTMEAEGPGDAVLEWLRELPGSPGPSVARAEVSYDIQEPDNCLVAVVAQGQAIEFAGENSDWSENGRGSTAELLQVTGVSLSEFNHQIDREGLLIPIPVSSGGVQRGAADARPETRSYRREMTPAPGDHASRAGPINRKRSSNAPRNDATRKVGAV